MERMFTLQKSQILFTFYKVLCQMEHMGCLHIILDDCDYTYCRNHILFFCNNCMSLSIASSYAKCSKKALQTGTRRIAKTLIEQKTVIDSIMIFI